MISTGFVIFNALVVISASAGFLALRHYYKTEMKKFLCCEIRWDFDDLK